MLVARLHHIGDDEREELAAMARAAERAVTSYTPRKTAARIISRWRAGFFLVLLAAMSEAVISRGSASFAEIEAVIPRGSLDPDAIGKLALRQAIWRFGELEQCMPPGLSEPGVAKPFVKGGHASVC